MTQAEPMTAPIRILFCNPALREPGTVYFTTRPGGLPTDSPFGWVIGLAQDGSLAVQRRFAGTTQDIRVTADRRIFFSQSAQGLLHELSPGGDVLQVWRAQGKWDGRNPPSGSIALPLNLLHHTVTVLPNGNFLTLDAECREFDNWHPDALEANHAGRAKVVGDIVCETTPSGEIVHRHKLLDILDPYRVTKGSFDHYWRKQGFAQSYDWSHVNAAAYDQEDDTYILSVRHQNAIVKIGRVDGALRWILGEPANWKEPWSRYLLKPTSGLEWPYHQHDCSITGRNRVLCFDNGNLRPGANGAPLTDSENYSRGVEFEIDPVAMEVSQVWSYGEGRRERLFGCYQGGAMRLPETGNTFLTFGGLCFEEGVPTSRNQGTFGVARLIEVTSAGEVALDLVIDDSASAQPRPFSAFRAAHLPP